MIFLFWLHSLCYAQEDVSEERAKELFFNGQLLYEEGEYDSAILAWERGYELTNLPAFLKNIAIAQEANGNYTAAIVYLKKYRAFAPFDEQEELKVWLTELEADLEQLVAQQESEALIASETIQETTIINDEPIEQPKINDQMNESTNVELQPTTFPDLSTSFPIWSTVGTGTFIAAASISTIQTHLLYSNIKTLCKLTNGVGYCSSEVQEDDLLNQFRRSQITSLVLWSASLTGVGLTTWQATTPVHLQISLGGFTIGGEF